MKNNKPLVTKEQIAKEFNENWARMNTKNECAHCGFMYDSRKEGIGEYVTKFKEYAKTCKKINGVRVSSTWEQVFKNKQFKRCIDDI